MVSGCFEVSELFKGILKPYAIVFSHVFKRPHTVKFPYERIKFHPRFRGRIVLSIDKCIGCGICERICPTKAIELVQVEQALKEGKKHPKIDFGRCCLCGFCVDYCPRNSLRMTGFVEFSEEKRVNLVYSPDKLVKEPRVTEVLPMLKKELEVEITQEGRIRYVGRRIK